MGNLLQGQVTVGTQMESGWVGGRASEESRVDRQVNEWEECTMAEDWQPGADSAQAKAISEFLAESLQLLIGTWCLQSAQKRGGKGEGKSPLQE